MKQVKTVVYKEAFSSFSERKIAAFDEQINESTRSISGTVTDIKFRIGGNSVLMAMIIYETDDAQRNS